MTTLSRWHLCQALVRNFWHHWSDEYVQSLRRYYKNHEKHRNVQEGDVVVLREDNMLPTKWPTARVIETFPGADGLVYVPSESRLRLVYTQDLSSRWQFSYRTVTIETRNSLIYSLYLLGRHGSASLCRDGQKTKWRLQCKYWRSNADISPGGEFYASEDS